MSDEQNVTGLLAIWKEIGMNIQVLGIAGFCGAVVKGLIAPEKNWKLRAIQASAGIFAAVFLGGLLGSLVEQFVTIPAYAYLASGFICGTAGEAAITKAQSKILGEDKGARLKPSE